MLIALGGFGSSCQENGIEESNSKQAGFDIPTGLQRASAGRSDPAVAAARTDVTGNGSGITGNGLRQIELPDDFRDIMDRLALDPEVTPYEGSPPWWTPVFPDNRPSPIWNTNVWGVLVTGVPIQNNPNFVFSPMKLLDTELRLMVMDGNNIETSDTLYLNQYSYADVAVGMSTGGLGVGTVPLTKLHVKAENSENTELRVEAADFKSSSIRFCGKSDRHQDRCAVGFDWLYNSGVEKEVEPYFTLYSTFTHKDDDDDEWKEEWTSRMVISHNGGVGIGSYETRQELMSLDHHRLSVDGDMLVMHIDTGTLDATGPVSAQRLRAEQITATGTVKAPLVRAEEIIVEEDVGADYVFEDGYEMMSLSEVERYVQANKHLPNVSPASEHVREGVSVGELQVQLLRTVEELTLRLIAQNKRIERLEGELAAARR